MDASTPSTPLPPSSIPPSPPPSYEIRIATQSTAPPHYVTSITSLVHASFSSDRSTILRWPRMSQYPHHYRDFISRIARVKLLEPTSYMLTISDPLTGAIIAHADWERRGPIGTAKMIEERGSWLMNLEKNILEHWDGMVTNRLLFPNPAADYTAIDKMVETWGTIRKNYWSKETRVEQWHLNFLCVHPDYRRKGLGAMLVKWGLEKARSEGVVAALEASRMGRGMYESLGFRVLGTQDAFGDEESVGYVMMWDGCGVEGGGGR